MIQAGLIRNSLELEEKLVDKAKMTTVPCQEERKVAWESVGIRNQDGELREQRELSRQCSVWLLHAGAPVRLRHLVVFIAERVFNMQGGRTENSIILSSEICCWFH